MAALAQSRMTQEWYADVPRTIRPFVIFGATLVVVLFGGFMVWASTAPLTAAVIAPGSFVATGQNKVIQHLEGGIIKDLMVREGDQVAVGTDLVELDGTTAKANARQLLLRRLRLEATVARLRAEARSTEEYDPPASVTDRLADAEVRAINDSQRENFRSSRTKLENDVQVLQQNITALQFQRKGLAAQVNSLEHQRRLLKDEYSAQKSLADQGILSRSSLRSIERAIADADGNVARAHSDMAVAGAQIAKYEKQIAQVRDQTQQAALDDIQNVEAQLEAVREQMRSADSVLDRTTIKSPVAGTVVNMYYHTAGGVIESGKPIMEILPSDVPLIIEARVPRIQIDEVHKNQAASVRLSALNQRTTPMLDGTVIYVSADAIAENNGSWTDEVYLARVSVPNEQIARVHGFKPTPGMPAEVLIRTHERTFFDYLTKPIRDSMARAFKES